MRWWVRAEKLSICGRCASWIEAGSPVQIVALQGVKEPRKRCEKCADGRAPEDLPPLPAKAEVCTPVADTWSTAGEVAKSQPFDWKEKAAGK